jgi:trimeric autotransporter adhesin
VDITTPLKTYFDYTALFVQGDWRLTPRLTLNLGLRYEAETGLKEEKKNSSP